MEALESRILLTSVVVNTALDQLDSPGSGIVSLRDAVLAANGDSSATAITFDPTVFATAKTIDLAGGTLELNNTSGTITVTGPADGVGLDWGGQAGGILIDGNVTAALSNLSLLNSSYSAIRNDGSITLNHITISGCSATQGGGIENFGSAVLNNVAISGNTATQAGFGGGGGGIYSTGPLTGMNVTISGNTSSAGGGGVYVYNGSASFTDVTIANNTNSDSVAGGGGAFTSIGASLQLTNCTISGNRTSGTFAGGGGVSNDGTTTLNDDTIAGNSATGFNSGGGINNDTGRVFIANCIVAGNTVDSNGTGPDVGNEVQSRGFNLIGETDGSGGWITGDIAGTSSAPLAANLAPLGSYGGATETMPPLPGSPAVDRGSNSLIPAGTSTDQRGLPRIANRTVDVGAVEIQPGSVLVASTVSLAASTTTALAGGSITLTATVASSSGGPTPTGSVAFLVDGAAFGTASLQSNGVASLTTSSLPVGTDSITARYDGDPAHISSGSPSLTVNVYSGSASITTLTVSPAAPFPGQQVIFTAKVSSISAGGPVPTGTVVFFVNGTETDDVTLGSDGSAAFGYYAGHAGSSDTVTATYLGDASYAPSSSSAVTEPVVSQAPASSAITPAFGSVALPSAVMAGAKVKGKVTVILTNHGSAMRGPATVKLLLAVGTGLDGSEVLLASSTKPLALKANQGKAFNFVVKSLPSTLPNGVYHLVAEVLDPAGRSGSVAAAGTIQVAAPVISLHMSLTAASPTTIPARKSASITVTVTNTGNEDASGTLNLKLSPSNDGVTPLSGVTLVSLAKNADIKAGSSKAFRLRFNVAALSAGSYIPYIVVSLGSATESAVGPAFIVG